MASRCGHTKTTDSTSRKVITMSLSAVMTFAITTSCTHRHFGTIICAVYVGIDCLTTSASLDVYLVLYVRLAGMAGLAVLSVCLS